MTDYERGRLAGLEEARRTAAKHVKCYCWECSDECCCRREGAQRCVDDIAYLVQIPPTVVVVDAEAYQILQTQHRDLMRDSEGR